MDQEFPTQWWTPEDKLTLSLFLNLSCTPLLHLLPFTGLVHNFRILFWKLFKYLIFLSRWFALRGIFLKRYKGAPVYLSKETTLLLLDFLICSSLSLIIWSVIKSIILVCHSTIYLFLIRLDFRCGRCSQFEKICRHSIFSFPNL